MRPFSESPIFGRFLDLNELFPQTQLDGQCSLLNIAWKTVHQEKAQPIERFSNQDVQTKMPGDSE